MTKFSRWYFAVPLLVVLGAGRTRAQTVPFDSTRWEFQAGESKIVEHLGRQSLYLKSGLAIVKESQFTDGVLEFDIACSGERGFMGAFWRMQDVENFEEFYLRPHQSGNPDANQYQPVCHGVSAWQLYYGEGYGAAVKYDFNQWLHVKILVSGAQAEVYIQNMAQPVLFVSEQKREIKSGKVGLSVGDFAPAFYSNFSFVAMKNVPLQSRPKASPPAPVGTVMSWLVSDSFSGASLEKKFHLAPADKQPRRWQRLACESSGLANLARVQGVTEEKNTVFVRLVILAEHEHVKKIKFGFSDEVKVYCNDRLLYGGSDIYRSRDYRFLGTLGLYDELYLPLRQGENEVLFAITENFGGWGIKAQFDDMKGIKLQE